MSDSDLAKMPDTSRAEWALPVARVGASFLPVVGGAAAELLGTIVMPQLEKRRTACYESIANDLYELQKRVANPTSGKLAQDEAWVRAVRVIAG